MPRSKTGACSVCHAPMWTGTGSAGADSMICRPCRRQLRQQAQRDADELYRRCDTCGLTWDRPASSPTRTCPSCRRPRCEVCGERFTKSHSKQRTCGRRCGVILAGRTPGGRPVVQQVHFKVCPHCGQTYCTRSVNGLHDDPDCRAEQHRWLARTSYYRLEPVTQPPLRAPRADYETRLFARIGEANEDGCWPWLGTWARAGYGTINRDGTSITSYRAVWEWFEGPVPDGTELDHLCHTYDVTCTGGVECPHRLCVNPGHLEVVSPEEHTARTVQHMSWIRKSTV